MERLIPLVYPRLLELARHRMLHESPANTMRPTELVHEAYLRLADQEIPAKDRSHFYALCARLMRLILIDHARTHLRAKRGGGAPLVDLDRLDAADPQSSEGLLEIHDTLDKLAKFDSRKAQAIELCVFGGFEQEMAAQILNVSSATLRRDLKLAKAWLYRAIHERGPGIG
jgi:RNA polymerase sigma factor (TIGR02999 family)